MFRIIARLDVKPPFLVKGVHLEGLRKIGNVFDFANLYFEQGIDEIIYQDIVASLYQKSTMDDLITKTSKNIFVPLTVGGGIKDKEQAIKIIRLGADKISLNTSSFSNTKLINEIGFHLGSQAVVLNIESKKVQNGWECLVNSGRDHTNVSVLDRIESAAEIGAGEILLTSVDKEGTLSAPDFELIKESRKLTKLPIIYHGGVSNARDVIRCAEFGLNAVAIASALHYNILNIFELKKELINSGFKVRL